MNAFYKYKVGITLGLYFLIPSFVYSNTRPVANAGPDQTLIYPINYATLTGTGSDPDGSISAYRWLEVSYTGPSTLSDRTLPNLTVVNMRVGVYVFELVVTDNGNLEGRDQVTIFVNYPPENYNWIKETTVLVPGIKEVGALANLTVVQKSESAAYFDGLGRPMQKVDRQASPDRFDVVQPIVYDLLGREPIKYLPYVSAESNGNYKPNAVGAENNTYTTSPQYLFYQNAPNVAHDQKPYAQSIFEASPLDRILEQGAPGETWQPGDDATIKSSSHTNAANEVQLWKYQTNMLREEEVVFVKYYEPNTLFKTVITDEHQSQVIEYKNAEGQVLLKMIQNGDQYLSTYYIYDDYGQLRLVIPPQGNAALPNPPAANYIFGGDALRKWCFSYQYDSKHRLIGEKAPGVGYSRMVYDQRDRVVLTQDAAQALTNEWIYVKYDALSRPVISGKCTDGRSLSAIQASIDGQLKWFEEPSTTGHGYTQSNCFPLNASNDDVLTVTYYDNYSHLGQSYWDDVNSNYSFVADEVASVNTKHENVKSLPTGAKAKMLGKNKWINTVSYYDNKNRPIQTLTKNYFGGIDRVSTGYDFVGKIIATKLNHSGGEQTTLTKNYVYDHAGRLLQAFHQVGAGTRVLLAENSYNKLGQLIDKGLGVKNQIPLQSVDYRYNIRGWLTSINNSALTNDGVLNNDGNDVFGMELLYEKPLGIVGLGYNTLPDIGLPSLKTLGIPATRLTSLEDKRHKQVSAPGIGLRQFKTKNTLN